MTKETTKVSKKVFSIQEHFKGKVKRLTLHFQDVELSKPAKGEVAKTHAGVFGTLQLYMEGNKETVENINFVFPLGINVELKNHVTAIIKEAIKNKEKEKNGGK